MNRKLKKEELTHGMFVQCQEPGLTSMSQTMSQTIYQIIIRDGQHYYKATETNWVMPGSHVTDIWWETEKTKSLNRDKKLNELGIKDI